MNEYTVTEQAYKNGYAKGYEDGKRDAVKHGRWEDVALRFTQVKEKCSICGGIVYAHGYNYCPNCGAKMDGEAL